MGLADPETADEAPAVGKKVASSINLHYSLEQAGAHRITLTQGENCWKSRRRF